MDGRRKKRRRMSPPAVAMVWFGYPAGKWALLFRFLTWIAYQLAMGAGKRPLFLYIYMMIEDI
jgi:hypothetical protein